jgi:hypothetical protein
VAICHTEGDLEMSRVGAKKPQTSEKDRMHFRLAPKIKARVARAAAITGQGLTDFSRLEPQ